MRIYNYSDKPVLIKGVPINDIEINIPYEDFNKNMVTHHTKTFNHIQQHHYLTIFNSTEQPNGYAYRITEHKLPDISAFSLILIATISFHLLVKIIQKVRQA